MISKHVVPVSLGILLGLTGCEDKSGKQSNTNQVPSSSPLTAPADYAGAVIRAQKMAEKTVDTASLSKAIQMFSVEQGRYPKTLQELVDEKYLPQLPPAPKGMRYQYDSKTGVFTVVAE